MYNNDKSPCCEDYCQEHPILLKHLKAVLLQNQIQNLTSIKKEDEGKVLHIEDSLAVLPEVIEAPFGKMADIGSGAGYPGIPLALVSGRKTTLIESNTKKARFLQEFITKQGIDNLLEVAPLRTEELALETPCVFSVITARAVAALPTLLELAAPLLIQRGHLIALKGSCEAEEEVQGAQAAEILGLTLIKKRAFVLSKDEIQRSVYVFKKNAEPFVKLPRRPGMAAKRPYGSTKLIPNA